MALCSGLWPPKREAVQPSATAAMGRITIPFCRDRPASESSRKLATIRPNLSRRRAQAPAVSTRPTKPASAVAANSTSFQTMPG